MSIRWGKSQFTKRLVILIFTILLSLFSEKFKKRMVGKESRTEVPPPNKKVKFTDDNPTKKTKDDETFAPEDEDGIEEVVKPKFKKFFIPNFSPQKCVISQFRSIFCSNAFLIKDTSTRKTNRQSWIYIISSTVECVKLNYRGIFIKNEFINAVGNHSYGT